MPKLDLTTQSDIQLELLVAKEENMLKAFDKLLAKIEELCQEEACLTLQQVLEYHEYSYDRMFALRQEIKGREKPSEEVFNPELPCCDYCKSLERNCYCCMAE